MIVEDDALIAMVLEEYVELLGFETAACVESVPAALDAIACGGIEAAIVDIHLADGETSDPVAEALVASGVPFLVATGGFVGSPAPVWQGRPIVEKPFTLASLSEAFERLK